MSDIKNLQLKIARFRDQRDWKKFHNPKDLAIDLSLEASEVLEHFLWKTEKEQWEHIKKNKKAVEEELADSLVNVLIMAYDFKINIVKAVEEKLRKNAKKYPVSKVKGKHLKYTSYEK
jgi:NTP pyrophosphatase (non-canonical NTP hydrolase)